MQIFIEPRLQIIDAERGETVALGLKRRADFAIDILGDFESADDVERAIEIGAVFVLHQRGKNIRLERIAVDERHDAIEKFIAIADQADGNDRRPNLRHPNPIVDDVLERLDGDIAAPGTPIDVFDADGENVDEIFVHSSVGNF